MFAFYKKISNLFSLRVTSLHSPWILDHFFEFFVEIKFLQLKHKHFSKSNFYNIFLQNNLNFTIDFLAKLFGKNFQLNYTWPMLWLDGTFVITDCLKSLKLFSQTIISKISIMSQPVPSNIQRELTKEISPHVRWRWVFNAKGSNKSQVIYEF